VTMKDSKACF